MNVGRGPELKAFLRKMRSRLAPEDVGLPAAKRRRRTPGLRIEEAAALAGVSLTWYSALESGNDTRVSANLLARVGDALRMSSEERELLLALTTPVREGVPCAAPDPLLQTVVDGFTSGPAFVSDRFWNVKAFNAHADAVYAFSSAAEPNLLVRMLTEPALCSLHVDWERIAGQMVAILHLSIGQAPDDARAIALVKRLQETSAQFSRWWNEYGLRRFEPTQAVLEHPIFGRLTLTFTSFVTSAVRPSDDPLVIVLQPAASDDTLARLKTGLPKESRPTH